MVIKDIFYSFQGEGPYIGVPQIFIRFYGCNIHCAYCDEPDFPQQRQKMSLDEVQTRITPLLAKNPHSISITGGEPLLQVEALKTLLPLLPLPKYLETNATLPDAVAQVADLFTYFSVDFKPGFDAEFIRFMAILSGRENVFVKYVLTRDTPLVEFEKMVQIVASLDSGIPLIIQPVTPFGTVRTQPTLDDITNAYRAASAHLKTVRIIPQSHKLMGIR